MTCLVTYKIFIIKNISTFFLFSFLPQIYVIVYSHEDEKKILIFNARKKYEIYQMEILSIFLTNTTFFHLLFYVSIFAITKEKQFPIFHFPFFLNLLFIFKLSIKIFHSFSFQSHFPINFFFSIRCVIVIICYPLSRHIL